MVIHIKLVTFKTEKKIKYFIRTSFVDNAYLKGMDGMADTSSKCVRKVKFSVLIIIHSKYSK